MTTHEQQIREKLERIKKRMGQWFGDPDCTADDELSIEYLLSVIDRLREELDEHRTSTGPS